MTALAVGATAPPLTGQALSDSTGVNIAGATLVLHLDRPDGTVAVVTPAVVSYPDGTWRYDWQDGDLAQAGSWRATLEVTYSNGKLQYFGPTGFSVGPHKPHP